jgi:hypothetical protein
MRGTTAVSDERQLIDFQARFGKNAKLAFRLQATAVALDLEPQENRGVIRRPARHLRINLAEPQPAQIRTLDKGPDNPDRVVLLDPLFNTFRK